MVTATFVTTPRHSSDYISLTGNQHESSSPLSSSTARIEKHGCSSTQHRQRFLSDAERRLSEDLGKTRASMESMDVADRKLWHCQPPATVAKLLDVNFKTGLNTHDAQARLAESGKNVLEAESKTPIHILFLLQFANLIVLMLLFASFASIALQEWVEGIAILMIITVNATIATYQERSASNALEALNKMSNPQCVVIRNATQQTILSEELVPGDIVLLVTGDVVPADIRLLQSADLKVNEMILTGESEDVSKRYNAPIHNNNNQHGAQKLTADNMVFSSTTVAAGNATGVVVETGMSTRVGSIALLLQGGNTKDDDTSGTCHNPVSKWLAKYQPKLTPLQRALHHLGVIMGIIALSVCILVFIVGLLRRVEDPIHSDRPIWLTMIMLSVSLAVSAVPEGLPMVVTICLSSVTAGLVKQHVLVRKLAAVETLGAASVICTDKTGTLTEGKMTAVKLFTDFETYDISGKGFNPEGDITDAQGSNVGHDHPLIQATLLSCVLCSNTRLRRDEDTQMWTPLGNSSEAPLVVAAAKVGIWEDQVLAHYPRIMEIPFSSSRKMMITVHALPPKNHEEESGKTGWFNTTFKNAAYMTCVKGAPNVILDDCSGYCSKDGNTIVNFTPESRLRVMEAVDQLSSEALRVLAVAIRPLESLPMELDTCDDVDEKFRLLSTPLIFCGLVASIDPERDGVRAAIATAREASVRTIMITGDYLKTAVAIAENIDLIEKGTFSSDGSVATDCSVLRPLNDGSYIPDADIDAITSVTSVFARAKPEDKIVIVQSLQRQDLVAAMTGDGVNDAPALKEADIGVAMGITGTEVAKGASDMVLTDDNFCSIVSAVEKGRVIYANIQKFVMFLLSTNVGEILLIFTAIAAGLPLPLQPLQILILNLFSDGMPAVALSLEPGDPSIMTQKPRPKSQPIIHGRLWTLILANALFIATSAMTVFVIGVYWNFRQFLIADIVSGADRTLDEKPYRSVVCERFTGSRGWQTYGDANLSPESDVTFDNYECIVDSLGRAQTMTFICITMTEVFRAYTVRSFTDPVYHHMWTNHWMQYAAVGSILLTLMVTNIPVVMDSIFGFRYIPYFMWLVALAGAFNSVFWGEMLKFVLRRQDRAQQREIRHIETQDHILLEIQGLRAQVERMEQAYHVQQQPQQ